MISKKSALAVLMDTVDVRHVFPKWPDDMNLAVCLLNSGECQMFIYRREEASGFPARMRGYLNLPVSEVCIFPATAGYPSRKLLYSDEQRLQALVAEAPELTEEAIDYSANYLFALEEGLDPAAFLRRSVVAKPDVTGAATVDAVATKPILDHAVKSAAPAKMSGLPILPTFLSQDDIVLPGPQFRSASEISASEEPQGVCRLVAEQNGWIVIERSGGRGVEIRVSNPGNIFLRDDRHVVAIKLEPAWPEVGPLPTRIQIRASNLPRSLRAVLAESVGDAMLESDGKFLFLNLTTSQPAVLPIPAPEPKIERKLPELVVEKAPKRKPSRWSNSRRRLWLATGVASLLVIIGVGLRLGTQSKVLSGEPKASIDWNLYRIDEQPDQSG